MTYKYVEFPRVVYGPAGETAIINSEDERPEGYVNTPDGIVSEDAPAKDPDRARKDEIRVFLDKHGVEYSSRLGLAKLEGLFKDLANYLRDKAEADAKVAAAVASTPTDAVGGAAE